MDTDPTTADYGAVSEVQQATWSSGDFHEIARQNVVMAEALCVAADPHGGERVLDVACGSGTAALVAARRYCEVTGVDYVPALIERARTRAAAEALEVDFRVADAQALPFPDATFDVVLSVYGVQFAPDQRTAASELLRVCRPGGRIALASPMSEGGAGTSLPPMVATSLPPLGLTHPSGGGRATVFPTSWAGASARSRADHARRCSTTARSTMPWRSSAGTSARRSALPRPPGAIRNKSCGAI